MLRGDLAVGGAIVGLIGCAVYAKGAWSGRVVPNVVTWTLWSLIPLIIFAASVTEGAGLQSLFTLAAGFGPLLVVAVVLRRPHVSSWRLRRLDWGCLTLSLLALALWALTQDGNVAISLSLVADLSAALPTVVKAFREPSTESGGAFLLYIVGAVMDLLATRRWTIANTAFPLYAAILYVVLSVLVLKSRWSHDPLASTPTEPDSAES